MQRSDKEGLWQSARTARGREADAKRRSDASEDVHAGFSSTQFDLPVQALDVHSQSRNVPR